MVLGPLLAICCKASKSFSMNVGPSAARILSTCLKRSKQPQNLVTFHLKCLHMCAHNSVNCLLHLQIVVRDKDEPHLQLAEVDVEESDLRRPNGIVIEAAMTIATFRCVEQAQLSKPPSA